MIPQNISGPGVCHAQAACGRIFPGSSASMSTIAEPGDKVAHLEAEIGRLRGQLTELGEECTDMARRLGVHERFKEAAAHQAAPLPPYEQVAAWQARRREMHAVRIEGGATG